nr:EVE domain-containing protein [Suttonella ornithocola]
MKSEPNCFSIYDLQKRPDQTEPWDGVRNYQARNFMREMKEGDGVFFYHSNTNPPGIVGTAIVVKEAYPDPTQFDPDADHYDPKSSIDHPRWDLVDVKFESLFTKIIPLQTLKEIPALSNMSLVQKGNRLSVMPVSETEWQIIMALKDEQ